MYWGQARNALKHTIQYKSGLIYVIFQESKTDNKIMKVYY